VANAVLYTTVANVAAIPASPANNAAVEVTNSTGIESFTPLSGLPAGFVGSSGLSVRIIYQTVGSTWTWIQYFPNDPENRYFKLSGGTITGPITVPQGTVSSPGVKFSGTGNDNTGVYSPGIDELGLVTNGVNRLSIDSAGAVAIPGTLGVTGAITGSLTGAASSNVLKAGDTMTGNLTAPAFIPNGSTVPTNGVYLPSANNVAISTNGTGRLFVDSSGLIGAGAAPSIYRLDVTGNGIRTREGANSSALVLGTYDAGGYAYITSDKIGTGSYQPLAFFTNGSERLRLTTTGALNFVGAGTAGSTQAVSFNGSAPVNSLVIDSSGRVGLGTSSPSYLLDVNGTIGAGTAGGVAIQLANGAAIRNSAAVANTIYFDTSFGSATHGSFEFRSSNAGTTRMLIDSSGRVGIGTSSPSTTLHVNGDGTFGSTTPTIIKANGDINFAFNYNGVLSKNSTYVYLGSTNNAVALWPNSGTNANPGLIVDSSNRVGIGSNNPQGKLVVSNSGAEGCEISPGSGFVENLYYNRATSSYVTAQNFAALHRWGIGGNEAMRLDASSRLLVGTSSARANFYNSTTSPRLQVEGTDTNSSSIGLISSANGVFDGANLLFAKSRGTTVGSNTIVQSGDSLGFISFQGSDGSEFVDAANIGVYVDGTPGSNDMPGRLVFSTTSDGASSPTERMRLNSSGYLKASNDGTYVNATSSYHELRSTTNTNNLIIRTVNGSMASELLQLGVSRAANSAYAFLFAYSTVESGADLEFNLRGDGNAFADGTWSGGGADYAEYFEWSDGNPDKEDRRGISVVLDGNQIRPAVDGEDPIGVISGNPSVIGDAAWNKWSGKYLRDDYGTYILDENGDRQLNPAYDPDQEYVNREQRPEWDCVGLMGKLRIRKGQPTGSRWIKMRDISDSVEEWLVR
jgi:hypothetical protein